MCGLTGLLDLQRRQNERALAQVVVAMAETLRHRGPDCGGTWVDADAGVALGHRRLSVLDPSEAGRQPMASASGRYVVSYNGEIYNFRALRKELEHRGARFRGGSDTEVLLAAVEQWGLAAALERFNGMFAFALWDSHDRELHLARDRLGEKPLYYGWSGPVLIFGSELKALRAHPGFRAEIDRGALALYLRHNCVPGPRSIYEGVTKLLPGTYLTIATAAASPEAAEPQTYWSAGSVVEAGADSRGARVSTGRLVDELEALLRDSVHLRMEADVPLGAFLSGGVDSSLVVALMQAVGSGAARTFTIGFDDAAYDESGKAAAVARHLGTDHNELRVLPSDAMAIIPDLPRLFDEPFADDSQVTTALLSRLARRQVTVALSGDGGDELFGGYNRYAWARPVERWRRRLPARTRRAGGRVLGAVTPETWDALLRRGAPVLPRRLAVRTPAVKVQKLVTALSAESSDEMYFQLVSHWKDPAALVLGTGEPSSRLAEYAAGSNLADPVERMMYLDLMTYLPDDVLVNLDRASMGVGLETRVPLLDHRIAEFAWRLPVSMKLRDGQGKWLLRQVLYRYVPRSLIERPKTGFGLPLGSWLREPLREWAESLLDERRIRDEGFLDGPGVRKVWNEHLSGRREAQYELWDVLMFQSWLEHSGAA